MEERDADRAIEAAIENARFTEADEYNILPEVKGIEVSEEQLELYDARFDEVTSEQKVDLALELEAKTCAQEPRVTLVETALYADSRFTVALVNSNGFSSHYRGTDCYCFSQAIARDGDESHSGFGFSTGRSLAELDMNAAAQEAAERAVWLLGARSMAPERCTVVLDNVVASEFIGAIADAFSAESVQRGRSLLAGKVGQQVGSPLLDLFDDGVLPRGSASAPFDDEGVPSRTNQLIAGGVLQGYLYDTYTAAREGRASTGNARRGGFRSRPRVSPTNLYIPAGPLPREELLREVGDGVLILQLVGVHAGVNPISGEISLGALGMRIRDGAIAEPLREITIAGQMLEMLQGIVAVASDLRFVPMGGSLGAPTIAISGVMVSGREGS